MEDNNIKAEKLPEISRIKFVGFDIDEDDQDEQENQDSK